MIRTPSLALASIVTILFLVGCAGHEPLPRLNYKASTPLGSSPRIPASVTLETGLSIGHSLTSYAAMPGGYMMPITNGPSATGDFNADDQAAFVDNLTRVLTERGLILSTPAADNPAATIAIKFLKTEHFPEMQDYTLEALVVARHGNKVYEHVHHVSTIDSVNLAARMFQNGIDGRRHAGELLLAAIVTDLEKWILDTAVSGTKAPQKIIMSRPFSTAANEIIAFMRERYERPSTFWTGGIDLQVVRPSEHVCVIELRWSNTDSLPPFCLVDIYAEGDATRIEVRERDSLLSAKAHVTEGIKEFVEQSHPVH